MPTLCLGHFKEKFSSMKMQPVAKESFSWLGPSQVISGARRGGPSAPCFRGSAQSVSPCLRSSAIQTPSGLSGPLPPPALQPHGSSAHWNSVSLAIAGPSPASLPIPLPHFGHTCHYLLVVSAPLEGQLWAPASPSSLDACHPLGGGLAAQARSGFEPATSLRPGLRICKRVSCYLLCVYCGD